ncbi:MAG TPA: D-glycero-beta-D-manno-heptose 1,7-bisphosphate 7-phosphatase [Bacteroidota bacterium]|nr:D-glycero-beta-D-manno-heptose 1,7-bisphosphate 7-phosphatase [Bacteroidota bacterium]
MGHVGIFLDRDGTINEEVDFVRSTEEFHLIEGSAPAIRELNQQRWRVFVVTNQSGIARGYLTEAQLAEIHSKLEHELHAHGAAIDAIYYCPHHPEFGTPPYRAVCDCRKPNIGMMTRAIHEFDLDPDQLFVVGDRLLDMQMGSAAGARCILVLTGYGKKEQELCETEGSSPDYVADNLYGAVQYIKRSLLADASPAV